MKLSELLAGIDHRLVQGDIQTRITAGACFDVDRVAPGALYIAVPDHPAGGPEFVGPALARGAAAVLVECGAIEPAAAAVSVSASEGDACVVQVPDARRAAAIVASRYHGEPGRQMDMVAITGTNGKTSVSYMVESILRISEGARVGVIGTSGSRVGDDVIPMPPTALTTPESPDLQYLLARMRDLGVGNVVLEATSMGLLTHRVDHAFLDVGVFTNLTQDHLDDHGTMAAYRDAKLRLFQGLCRRAVVNADDPVCAAVVDTMPGAVATYGLDSPADYRATDLVVDPSGTRFTLWYDGRAFGAAIPVPGRFSASNALAAVAACHLLGHDLESLVAALARMPQIPGRFEQFRAPRGTSVIVDYAHSPDSLDKVLTAIGGYATGRVITVFGCGGDRDATKRAEMGQIAGKHSDLCVLTSDNPRTEDPEAILDQIAKGLILARAPYARYADRRQAIRYALSVAGPRDSVLVAGKGSEPYQVVGETLVPFSDMATVRELATPDVLTYAPVGAPPGNPRRVSGMPAGLA